MMLNPYLTFDGRCEAAFRFYAKCLSERGAKIELMLKHSQSPMADQTPAGWENKIMHAHLSVANWVLMGADAPPDLYRKPEGFAVTLSVDDPAEAERLFQALSENGTVRMAIQPTFWAQRFGMFIDQFDIPWMINGGMQSAQSA